MKELTLKQYKEEFKIKENKLIDDITNQSVPSKKINLQGSTNGLTKEAHKQALDIRKFEIDMYWKRATYFWTIIGVIFAGYFLLMKDDVVSKHPTLILLLNCIGFIFSLSWYLVNRGSKYWQNNWEKHVDLLEDKVTGPLYKIVIEDRDLKLWHIHKEYSYSVSKINQFLSLFVTIIWFFMGLYLILSQFSYFYFLHYKAFKTSALIIGTLTAASILIFRGRSAVAKDKWKQEDLNKSNMLIRKREIKETEE
ncbi:hypothetical protein CN396_01725 [Bacillus thuringiensis]|uniref:RipA family octameric membrane protein n=1 Tax=Bacillus thuringiensis TaxID=1428 RepID=UPI000BF50FE7|nr:hypothetical protein [Bacillus thuringiensis]PFB50932.1 hypothetical protein CN396_01725 [Bacillus thuringiensis]